MNKKKILIIPLKKKTKLEHETRNDKATSEDEVWSELLKYWGKDFHRQNNNTLIIYRNTKMAKNNNIKSLEI